ncbi:MAG: type II toxin-antitoxin system death-on-curing family toxin [Acidimicrobiia bacterium]
MTEVEYLTLEDLLGLVRRLGVGPVRDLGLLDAGISRPQSSAFGEDAYPTVKLKAAALLHSIVTNHALVDGNKRLGWLATTVFLDVNGEPVSLDDDDAFQLVLEVTEGTIGVEEIADRLISF